ncbi:hypothetical protein HAX54_028437, partial [Datura stramonium]|nr:hypothetical protein [Datura stramonium]
MGVHEKKGRLKEERDRTLEKKGRNGEKDEMRQSFGLGGTGELPDPKGAGGEFPLAGSDSEELEGGDGVEGVLDGGEENPDGAGFDGVVDRGRLEDRAGVVGGDGARSSQRGIQIASSNSI